MSSNISDFVNYPSHLRDNLRAWRDEMRLQLTDRRYASIKIDAGADFDKFYFLMEALKSYFQSLGWQCDVTDESFYPFKFCLSVVRHTFFVTVVRP